MTFPAAHPNRPLRFSENLAVALSLLVLPTIAPVVRAQDQQPEDIVRVSTDLIAIPVAVTDSRGNRISAPRAVQSLERSQAQRLNTRIARIV